MVELSRNVGNSWAEFVSGVRKYAGLSQTKFGAEIPVRQQTVGNWESGKPIGEHYKLRLAEIFDLSIEEVRQVNDGVDLNPNNMRAASVEKISDPKGRLLGAFIVRIEHGPPLNEVEALVLRELLDLPLSAES